jgi:hypothetical protein
LLVHPSDYLPRAELVGLQSDGITRSPEYR